MRRLVMFVGPTRPEPAEASNSLTPSEPASLSGDPAPDRPLDVAATGVEPLAEANVVDAVGQQATSV